MELIEDSSAFEGLREEWNGLLAESSAKCFFLTWEWLYTWWKHLSQGRKLSILAVRLGTELVAVAPLVLKRSTFRDLSPFRSLGFLGVTAVGSDYVDFIVKCGKEQEACQVLADHLAGTGLMVEFRQLKRAASVAAELGEELKRRGWRISAAKTSVCPFINLSGHSWESYIETLGPAHRYNFKRRLKNLARRFEVRFERARSGAERREFLAHLISLHNARWRDRGRVGAFSTPALRAFHEEISERALARGWLRLFVLRLDGKPAAALYGFKYDSTFYFYQSGFDPRYKKESVGLIAMGLAIKSAVEEGVEEYDLLHGDETYKLHWAAEARELGRLDLYPPRMLGWLQQHAMSVKGALRGVVRSMLGDAIADRIADRRAF
jgi:CelD/BcsL family acetyltransferase involved in cellulose biosynthesis